MGEIWWFGVIMEINLSGLINPGVGVVWWFGGLV